MKLIKGSVLRKKNLPNFHDFISYTVNSIKNAASNEHFSEFMMINGDIPNLLKLHGNGIDFHNNCRICK